MCLHDKVRHQLGVKSGKWDKSVKIKCKKTIYVTPWFPAKANQFVDLINNTIHFLP